MKPSGSHPSDEVTRIITGCAEVIFELESADPQPVRADLLPSNAQPGNSSTERVCSQTPASPSQTRRAGLKAWIQRTARRRG